MKERIAESECKTVIKKNSVLLVETLITGSPDLLQPMSHDEMLAYMKHAYDFMAERVGEQNIVSAVIPLDEKTPHMHLCFVPLSEDNRLTAKEIVGNQARLSEFWQDGFYEHMHEKYEVIERGESAKNTHRKHIPVWLYKKAEHLDKMYSEVEAILSNIGMFNAKGKSEEALTVLREWAKEGEYFSSKVKETTKHIEGLEQEVKTLSAKVDRESSKVFDLTLENKRVNREIEEYKTDVYLLERQVERYKKLVEKIPPEIMAQIKGSRKRDDDFGDR